MAYRDSRMETGSQRGRGKGTKRSLPILNGIEESESEVSSEFLCPICLDLLNEPHMTMCGHTFCRACLKESIEINKRCPKCTFVVYSSEKIFPNHLVNEQIKIYKKKIDLKQTFFCKTKKTAFTELKNYLNSDSSPLGLDEITEMIALFKERKNLLQSQSQFIKYDLIKTFLSDLHKKKEEQLVTIGIEKKLVEKDFRDVCATIEALDSDDSSLNNDTKNFCNVPNNQTLTLSEIDSENPGTSDGIISERKMEEGFDVPSVGPVLSDHGLSVKKKRMRFHFQDFSDYYFSLRTPDVDNDTTFTRFGNCITKFTQFSNMKLLATIDAGDGLQASSNIASSIEFDKDCEYFAVAGLTKKIRLFDYSHVVRDFVDMHFPSGEMMCDSKISCVSWSSYHKSILVSSDYDGTVTVWDTFNAQKLHIFKEHQKRCWSVDFNKMDVKLIASGSDDSKVKLWHLDTDRSTFSLEAKANVCCVQFNPCSRFHLAFGSADHCVHYYDLRNTKNPLRIFQGHKKAVSYVKFISKEEIVSASTDSQLKIWNINNSSCVQSLHGHTNEKNFVGLATDGDYVACGSENNSLYVYYKELPKKLFSFRFDHRRLFLDDEAKDEDSNAFVSAVCWRKGSNVVVAGNSLGVIKILQMV